MFSPVFQLGIAKKFKTGNKKLSFFDKKSYTDQVKEVSNDT